MASHSNILAGKIAWTEEPSRLQYTGSQRVGQDWARIHLKYNEQSKFPKIIPVKNFRIPTSLIYEHPGGPLHAFMSAQSCPTLCNAMGCSPPGSSVHAIFPARILEWIAISYCRGHSRPRERTRVSCIFCTGRQSLPLCHSGSRCPVI